MKRLVSKNQVAKYLNSKDFAKHRLGVVKDTIAPKGFMIRYSFELKRELNPIHFFSELELSLYHSDLTSFYTELLPARSLVH